MNSIAYTDSSRTVASIDTLEKHIEMAKEKSPIKSGSPYHLAALINERTRVADELRNMGFYRFKDDDLEFAADTTVGDHLVDMRLRVKLSTGDNRRTNYVSEVYVHGDHDDLLAPRRYVSGRQFEVHQLPQHVPAQARQIQRVGCSCTPGTITRNCARTRPNAIWAVTARSARCRWTSEMTKQAALIADVLLTPQKRFSLSQSDATSKSNNFVHPEMKKVGFKDRDLLRGAELLTVDLNGRFESQLAGQNKGTNAYEIE